MGLEAKENDALEITLGYSFQNKSLLERALTHPSYLQSRAQEGESHNQRLEFLGDAVLGMILAEVLFERLPDEREGILTRNRSALAKGAHLSQLARKLGIQDHLRISEAEERNHGRDRDSILEDAIEAIIGAIYIDSDYPTTRDTILPWFGNLSKRIQSLLDFHNPKGRLQEHFQPSLGNECIDYQLLSESGPAHNKRFHVVVVVKGEQLGAGEGTSKKEAEEQAARAALEQISTQSG